MRGDDKLDRAVERLYDLELLQVIFPELESISVEELRKRTRSFPHLSENAGPNKELDPL